MKSSVMMFGICFHVILTLGGVGAAAAATNTYYVVSANPSPESPYNTWGKAAPDIQTAVNKAAADLVPGTTECLVLVSNGNYTLTSQILITNGITLRGFGGRDATFINGNYPAYTNRCIEIRGATTRATVDGFTITNGYNRTNLVAGGGVYVTNGVVSLVNCTISRNRSESHGGGIGLVSVSNAVITNCIVSLNTNAFVATGYGGGVYLNQTKGQMVDCTIVSNVQGSLGNSYGGGLYVDSVGLAATDLVVTNCTIAYNNGRSAGGGAYMAGQVTITHCIINDNISRGSSGGVQIYDGSALLAYSTIASNRASSSGGGVQINTAGTMYNCRIIGNYAGTYGGGLYKGSGRVRNCLVAGNQAGSTGGGVYISAVGLDMANCTIVRNYSAASGGGCIFSGAGVGSPITNVIVFGNQAAVSTNDVGPFTSISYSCAPELTAGANGNKTNDPLFVDAGSGYGTNAVVGDYMLQTNSPCIGAGTNQAWMTVEPVTDLAGNARIRLASGVVDMGAFEAYPVAGALTARFTATPESGTAPLQVVFTGETSGNPGGLTWQWIFGDGTTNGWSASSVVTNTYAVRTNAYTVTLNVTNAGGESASFSTNVMVYPAIAYVATNGLHIPPFLSWGNAATNIQAAVDVAGSGAGWFTTVLVSNGVYTVTNEITIAKGITLRGFSGNWADTVIKGGYPVTSNRCLSITGSGAVVDGFTITNGNLGTLFASGGGVNMTVGTLQNCLVTGNSSRGVSAAAGSGAGIYAAGGSVINCIIRNNSSANYDGGGLYAAGLVSNCLITGNSTPEDGGGMRISGATVDRCIIVGNRALRATAGGGGGGISKDNTTGATIRNSLIAGNQASSAGGGIYFGTGQLILENCTVVGNLASTNGGGVFAAISTASYALSGTNCIVVNNQATQAGATNDIAGVASFFGYSCSPDLVAVVNSNITADPVFAVPGSGYGTNHVVGNYHLKPSSPCANAGLYFSWMASATDLDGEPYVPDDSPNMGAYERTVKAGGSLIMLR